MKLLLLGLFVASGACIIAAFFGPKPLYVNVFGDLTTEDEVVEYQN